VRAGIANGRAVLSAQAMGADMAYIGSAFIATREANAVEAYKQMITECSANDIVHTNLITGVHGNYLKPSLVRAGLDPDNLPTSDPSRMDFSQNRQKPKAWKDIWGCGQGIGVLDQVLSAGELVDRLDAEYREACASLLRRVA
jgi:nitronate monooxygenase